MVARPPPCGDASPKRCAQVHPPCCPQIPSHAPSSDMTFLHSLDYQFDKARFPKAVIIVVCRSFALCQLDFLRLKNRDIFCYTKSNFVGTRSSLFEHLVFLYVSSFLLPNTCSHPSPPMVRPSCHTVPSVAPPRSTSAPPPFFLRSARFQQLSFLSRFCLCFHILCQSSCSPIIVFSWLPSCFLAGKKFFPPPISLLPLRRPPLSQGPDSSKRKIS